MAAPSSSSKQRSVVYTGLTATKGYKVCVLNSSENPILTLFEFPRTINGAAFFFSTPEIASGATYIVSTGGTLKDYSDLWNGWYENGIWSDGSQVGTFTSNSTVTTVGNSRFGGLEAVPAEVLGVGKITCHI